MSPVRSSIRICRPTGASLPVASRCALKTSALHLVSIDLVNRATWTTSQRAKKGLVLFRKPVDTPEIPLLRADGVGSKAEGAERSQGAGLRDRGMQAGGPAQWGPAGRAVRRPPVPNYVCREGRESTCFAARAYLCSRTPEAKSTFMRSRSSSTDSAGRSRCTIRWQLEHRTVTSSMLVVTESPGSRSSRSDSGTRW